LAQRYIFKETIDINANGKPFVNLEKMLLFSGSLAPSSNCRISKNNDVINLNRVAEHQYNDSICKINMILLNLFNQSHLSISIAYASEGPCSIHFDRLNRKKRITMSMSAYGMHWMTVFQIQRIEG